MQHVTCPTCNHENSARAAFCLHCGAQLDGPPVVRGLPRHADTLEDAVRHAEGREDSLEPGLIEELRAARAKLPPPLEGAPITCLRCGTLNQPPSNYCIGCGAKLALPEANEAHDPVPRAAAATDVGRVRENNEDRVGLWALDGVLLALVADGMGGAAAGEEASRLVVEAVEADFLGAERGSEQLAALSEAEIGEKLRAAVRRANRAIIQRAREDPALKGMGTTVTLAFVRGRRVVIAHVGDSRAYLVRGAGWINQITDDHSFVEALLASGQITREQAAVHPMRNVLYRALGQSEDTQADLYSRALDPGDTLVLCSDGLTRDITPQALAEIVAQHPQPGDAARALIKAANESGGEDNISVVVIRLEAAEDAGAALLPDPARRDDAD